MDHNSFSTIDQLGGVRRHVPLREWLGFNATRNVEGVLFFKMTCRSVCRLEKPWNSFKVIGRLINLMQEYQFRILVSPPLCFRVLYDQPLAAYKIFITNWFLDASPFTSAVEWQILCGQLCWILFLFKNKKMRDAGYLLSLYTITL